MKNFILNVFLLYPHERSSGVIRNHSVCPSVSLSVGLLVRPSVRQSVCADSCPAHYFWFWFDTGLPYLAHGCIIMRRFVAHIHDPVTMLTFDFKVKFIGFLTCSRVWLIICFWFDIGVPYLPYASITMRRYVAYIRDPDLTLTFDLNVESIGFSHLCVPPITPVCFDTGITYLAH